MQSVQEVSEVVGGFNGKTDLNKPVNFRRQMGGCVVYRPAVAVRLDIVPCCHSSSCLPQPVLVNLPTPSHRWCPQGDLTGLSPQDRSNHTSDHLAGVRNGPRPFRRPCPVPSFDPMEPSAIVWDLETVPDLSGFAAANDLVGKTDDEVREAIGDKFPKHIYHSIVCIGALVAHREGDHWNLRLWVKLNHYENA